MWLKPENLVEERYMIDNLDSFEAKVIKIDKEKDLALLEINGLPNDIKPVQFGNYNNVNVGETAFAIGHPGDLIWSFNNGMVSQLRQDYKWKYKNSHHFADVIQIQVPINPGNSGGPAFLDNYLVGVVSWGRADSEGLNFMIHHKEAQDFLKAHNIHFQKG